LDGEKNLKKKVTPRDFKTKVLEGPYPNISGRCKCDLPNKDLYQFKGILDVISDELIPTDDVRFTLTEN
jgi:hypothetical protein|tara:strand:+ start:736 stop:942 length:207 start_codon:yes stop_codon:yes gene_type:complete